MSAWKYDETTGNLTGAPPSLYGSAKRMKVTRTAHGQIKCMQLTNARTLLSWVALLSLRLTGGFPSVRHNDLRDFTANRFVTMCV